MLSLTFLEKWQVLSFRQLSSYISVLCFPFIHLLCSPQKSKALMPMKSSWCLQCLLVSHHWDYCNHRIMLRSVLILLQSPTSHLPLRVSIQSSLHRHIFLVALDTHLDNKPSVAISGLLFPRYSCPFLFPLTQQLFCVVQDLVMRSAPTPTPSSTRWHEERACQVLCSQLNWTYSRDSTAIMWVWRPCVLSSQLGTITFYGQTEAQIDQETCLRSSNKVRGRIKIGIKLFATGL